MVKKGAKLWSAVALALCVVAELGGCSDSDAHGPWSTGGAPQGGQASVAGRGGAAGLGGGAAGSAAVGGSDTGAEGGGAGDDGTARAGESGAPVAGAGGADACGGGSGDECAETRPALVAGSNHTCLLHRDGRVSCWGADTTAIYTYDGYSIGVDGVSSPPASRFRSLVAGDASTCGITEQGALECWGGVGSLPFPLEDAAGVRAVGLSAYLEAVLFEGGTLQSPEGEGLRAWSGKYKAVSTSDDFGCALRTDGEAFCFGALRSTNDPTAPDIGYGLNDEPEGPFRQITVGRDHACALVQDASIVCWGDTADGAASPPEGAFVAVDAGDSHTCGLKSDGTLACWGANAAGESTPPAGEFIAMAVGDRHGCALRADETVACWGVDSAYQASPPPELSGVSDRLSTVSVGGDALHIEDVREKDWQENYLRRGSAHLCGLRGDDSIGCFGADSSGQSTAPSGAFIRVSTGTGSSCALRENGELVCWGGALAASPERPTGELVDVSVGYAYACAIRADQTLACWTAAPEPPGQYEPFVHVGTPPSGAFAQVSVDGSTDSVKLRDPDYETHFYADACALDTSGDVHCWWMGADRVEAGPFTEVRVGYNGLTAALREDGAARVWVRGLAAWSRPGPLLRVGAGGGFVCGISEGGTISCFDELEDRPAIPGTYLDFAVSGDYVCGVREDGNVACFYGVKRHG